MDYDEAQALTLIDGIIVENQDLKADKGKLLARLRLLGDLNIELRHCLCSQSKVASSPVPVVTEPANPHEVDDTNHPN